jgi:hypothetical protein
MTDTISLETPKGGNPLWILHICYEDDVIGTIYFKDEIALKEFKDMFWLLNKLKWGLMQLDIDVHKAQNPS